MLGWLRGFLTDTDALEQRLTGGLRASEERLSRRMSVIEQRLAENEQVLRRPGHQIARITKAASRRLISKAVRLSASIRFSTAFNALRRSVRATRSGSSRAGSQSRNCSKT